MMKRVFIAMIMLMGVLGAKAQQQADEPFRAYLFNDEYKVYMRINLYEQDVVISWQEMFGQLPGFLAKESVVSTLSVLYGSTEALFQAHSLADVFALLVFCLLYTPCIAAVAAFKQEQGHGGAIKMVLFQCFTAWIVAFLIRHLLLVLG